MTLPSTSPMTSLDILQAYSLSDSQRRAALVRDCDVAVTAGAGTGKTRTLVARYLALLADGLPLRRIVAITFTRKAAREMRNRVRREIAAYLNQPQLSSAERQRWQDHFNRLDAARIGTIHNLCSEILHAHPAEVGIDPRFSVLDETQAALLVQEAAEATLAWAVAAEETTPLLALLRERPLLDLIDTLLANRLTVSEVADSLPADTIFAHWQAQLIARQCEQIDRLLADPDFVAAHRCLLTNQAIRTDDKCEIQRQSALAALSIPADAPLADRRRSLAALNDIVLTGGSKGSWPGGKEQLDEVKAGLRYLRETYRSQSLLALNMNGQDTAVATVMPAIYQLFHYAQEVYNRLKAERDALDFDDLEALAIELLENLPAVRSYWQAQLQALLVDEFQDTNARQARLVRLLCPDPGKLFIVGDAKQSIYRFRGADVTVFAAEKGQIQHADGALIDLDTSYRAHEQLLTDMNGLLAPVLGPDRPHRPSWVAPFAPLYPGGKGVVTNLPAPYVEFHLTIGNKAEALPLAATALVTRLAQLHADTDFGYGDMAILCRTSGAFQYYEDALDSAGIPYLTVAGKGFYERPEIRDLLNALQAIADPHDDLALVGLLRSPAYGISDLSLYQLIKQREASPENGLSLWQWLLSGATVPDAAEAARLQTAVSLTSGLNQQAGRIPVADICKQFLNLTHYRAILRRAGQPRALRNITKLLTDIHNSELVSITEFLEYAQALRDSGSREGEARGADEGVVQIMSIHAAKGLEFPVVVLGDASSESHHTSPILIDSGLGILLAAKDEDDAKATSYELGTVLAQEQEQAERDRLLYVALTRAEQMLLISGTIQQNTSSFSWKGWLGQLAHITGLSDTDLSGYDETGDRCHTFDLSIPESTLKATVYEPGAILGPTPPTAVPDTEPVQTTLPPLQDSLLVAAPGTTDEETPQRVWQVVPTAQRPEAPAWVIGTLVHEALALWRFPDHGFEAWVAARAREYGLTDPRQLHHAHTNTVRLLNRFMQHPRYWEISSADRRLHEVPFYFEFNSGMKTGYIDLLYQKNGIWRLIDFKTDRIKDEVALQQILAEKDYRQQVLGYGTAVQQLMGVSAQLELCWLDYSGSVHFTTVGSTEG